MDMTEFQAFDIRAWAVEGLTKHIKVATTWVAGKRPRGWPTSTTLASALLVTAGTLFGTTAIVAVSGLPPVATKRVVTQQTAGRDLIIGSPERFWADIASEMRSWKSIDDAEDLDIPPFV